MYVKKQRERGRGKKKTSLQLCNVVKMIKKNQLKGMWYIVKKTWVWLPEDLGFALILVFVSHVTLFSLNLRPLP